jgi:hypothetical protein
MDFAGPPRSPRNSHEKEAPNNASSTIVGFLGNSLDSSVADVAVQRGVGILSEQWIRSPAIAATRFCFA